MGGVLEDLLRFITIPNTEAHKEPWDEEACRYIEDLAATVDKAQKALAQPSPGAEKWRALVEALKRYLAVKKSWDNQLKELKELKQALAALEGGSDDG